MLVLFISMTEGIYCLSDQTLKLTKNCVLLEEAISGSKAVERVITFTH